MVMNNHKLQYMGAMGMPCLYLCACVCNIYKSTQGIGPVKNTNSFIKLVFLKVEVYAKTN